MHQVMSSWLRTFVGQQEKSRCYWRAWVLKTIIRAWITREWPTVSKSVKLERSFFDCVVVLTFYFIIGFFHFIPQALWLPSDPGTYLKMSYKFNVPTRRFNVKLRSNDMMVQHHSKTTTNIQLEVVSHPNFYICCGRRPMMLPFK